MNRRSALISLTGTTRRAAHESCGSTSLGVGSQAVTRQLLCKMARAMAHVFRKTGEIPARLGWLADKNPKLEIRNKFK